MLKEMLFPSDSDTEEKSLVREITEDVLTALAVLGAAYLQSQGRRLPFSTQPDEEADA